MPELPEVETMRRGILPIVGCRIDATIRPPCRKRPIQIQPRFDAFRRRTEGRQIAGIGRCGKRVIVQLDDEQSIVIEPRMTGLVLLCDPPTKDHLRLRMELSGGEKSQRLSNSQFNSQLLFWDRRGLGTIRLMHPEEKSRLLDQRLGVDALQITWQELRQRLFTSRRPIKVALLDQSAVAGIGNLYASEILFQAGIDPRVRCDRLTGPQWQRITFATHEILQEAIRYEGSTLSDGTYRNAINGEGSYQNHHRVYDRASRVCPRCEAGSIRRIVQAQRSTFFCPVCQQRRGLHASLRQTDRQQPDHGVGV